MAATRANQVGGSDYTSGSIREDLKQGVSLNSAKTTPLISILATTKAMQPRHEWLDRYS